MQIFMQLEESNLVEIQRMQETETELENMRQLKKQKKLDFDKDANGQDSPFNDVFSLKDVVDLTTQDEES